MRNGTAQRDTQSFDPLEAQAAVLPPDVPRHTLAVDVSVELEELRAKLASTEWERDEALSAPACKRQAMSRTVVVLPGTPPPIPDSFVPACLSSWMDDRHAELSVKYINNSPSVAIKINRNDQIFT